MADTGNAGNVASSPLDAERQKLKAQGYTDTEISQILIARAVGGQQAGPAAQGVMSNVPSSIIAIAGHARALVPSFRSDFTTIFNRGAPFGSRVGSVFSLLVKMAVVAVLAYAGWQEWQQHIISATAIADAEVRKRHAEECSARAKSIVDTTPVAQFDQAFMKLAAECSPLGFPAEDGPEAKEKKKKIDVVLGILPEFPYLTQFQGKLKAAEQARDYDRGLAIIQVFAVYIGVRKELDNAQSARDYAKAFHFAQVLVSMLERPNFIDDDRQNEQLILALMTVARDGLLAHEFAASLAASERILGLNPAYLPAEANRAHAHMLLGHIAQARNMYFLHSGQIFKTQRWESIVKEGFSELRQAGITNPLMSEVETAFSAKR